MKLIKMLARQKWGLGFIVNDIEDVVNNKPLRIQWVDNPYRNRWFADPFILEVTNEEILLLVEEMTYSINKGRIALLTISREHMLITDVKILLEKDTHLSFPSIFRKEHHVYVYPENHDSGALCLYEYVHDKNTPHLNYVRTLCNRPLTDAIMVNYAGKDIIVSTEFPNQNGSVLNIYEPHEEKFELSQTIQLPDKHARMAGQFFVFNGDVYRPAQDCNHVYGEAVIIEKCKWHNGKISFEPIRRITSPHPQLCTGLHTFNAYKNVIVVDAHGYEYPFWGRIISWFVMLKKHCCHMH